MNRFKLIIILLVLYSPVNAQKKNLQRIDLSGTWRFAIDHLDKGITEKWYNRVLNDSLTLPGSMTSNGKGDDITLQTQWTGQIVDSSFYKKPEYAKYRVPGNIKVPFWLQPLKYYKGAAWYQKQVEVPANWKDHRILLFLERCHWESRLWIDDKMAGMQNSLGTPHQYDLTGLLTPGKHRITLCIDNRTKDIDVGKNPHSISDHTQTNWNGIVGKLYLEAHPLVSIKNVQIYPDIQRKSFRAEIKVDNLTQQSTRVDLLLSLENVKTSPGLKHVFEISPGENNLKVEYPIGSSMKLWSEFHPDLYTLKTILSEQGSDKSDTYETTFGMREFKAVGKQIRVNGQPTFLRGTLECAIFPKTGYPSTDLQDWLRIFKICRSFGLNHMRFHSWCPPQAAFDAADQTGFYLQVECSTWGYVGDGKPIDKYLYDESRRMVETYGNHPSFCMLVHGNEPFGGHQVKFLTQFVNYWKEKDNRRIYSSGAARPLIPENDYQNTPGPRIQHFSSGLNSIINSQPPRTDYDWSEFNSKYPQPIVSHEIGEWCVYPNFREISKYNGVLRARNFEIFRESLQEHGMAQLAESFLYASGKLQVLCYKADIEAALRTPNFGGFQLLDLHDFPGQGTALVGVLDAFWDQKGYVSPTEYRQFCNTTVPLARLKKCTFTNNENFEASVEIAHFGEKPIEGCKPVWRIVNKNGKAVESGYFIKTNIPIGNGFKLGDINLSLNKFSSPEELKLEVLVNNFRNSWDFWVYPAKEAKTPGEENIFVTQQLDDKAKLFLENGGSVLLNLKKGTLSKEMGGDVIVGFSSIFWNSAWTGNRPPHTLGILCNPKHPALESFPTESYSNWEWWDAMTHSQAINIGKLSPQLKPIVRAIDDWVTNRPLGLILEAKVGKGRIIISGIDLTSDLEKRPESRQLLFSLKKYMAGERFNPSTEITYDQIRKLTN
jgi:hypothetical protein